MGAQPLTIVDDVAGFDALAPGWGRLASHLDSPMQQHAWLRASLAAFDTRPYLLVVGDLDAPAAVAPLGLCHGRLQTLGRELWEPTDFLYSDDDALAELVAAVARTRRPMLLSRLLNASPAAQLVRAAYGHAIVRARESAAPVLRLDDSWVEPERHLSSRRRSDLRRARRRAEAEGGLTFELLSPAERDASALLAEAVAVEDRSWKGDRGTSLARDARRRRFFELYAEAAARDGSLRIAFARIDGSAVAMQIAVEYGGALWLLKIGYDESFARCSPGQLLIAETVREAAVRGLETYEFLGGAEAWTDVWTHEVRDCSSLRIYPRSPASIPALIEDAGERVRRWIGK